MNTEEEQKAANNDINFKNTIDDEDYEVEEYIEGEENIIELSDIDLDDDTLVFEDNKENNPITELEQTIILPTSIEDTQEFEVFENEWETIRNRCLFKKNSQ